VRAAQVRRRVVVAWEAIQELQAERRGLEEVLQNLRIQHESLTSRLAVLEAESKDYSERIAQNSQRLDAIEAEIELLTQESEGLSGQRSFIGRQTRKLGRAAAVLQEEVDKRRRQMNVMQASFETITSSVLRMDSKLQLRESESSDRQTTEKERDES
jgi:chromosome segregation ATPase